MKRLIPLIAIIAALTACNEVKVNTPPAPAKPPLQAFISRFKAAHADWQNNSVAENRINDIFAGELDGFLKKDSALTGLVFKLEGVNEYAPKYYAVKLVNQTLNDSINFEVVGLCPEKLINSLVEGKLYTVTAYYHKPADELAHYFNYGIWNVNVGSDKLVSESKIYTGVSLYDIKDLKPVQ